MKKNYQKTYFCSKCIFICLIGIIFLFASCGKDKTIEKIIYGDNATNTLSRDKFNAVSIKKEFNNIDDFHNYVKQCYTDKTNITGAKFKVKGHFDLSEYIYYQNGDDKYYYKQIILHTDYSNRPYLYLSVNFVNTDLNSSISSVEEIIFIITSSTYDYDSQYFGIGGYSYL